jgi:hypothetical protein
MADALPELKALAELGAEAHDHGHKPVLLIDQPEPRLWLLLELGQIVQHEARVPQIVEHFRPRLARCETVCDVRVSPRQLKL